MWVDNEMVKWRDALGAHKNGGHSIWTHCSALSLQGDADVPLSEVEGEDESPDYSYRLVCVIMHRGISPNCGGYPCFAP
jgi:hypothetical protein